MQSLCVHTHTHKHWHTHTLTQTSNHSNILILTYSKIKKIILNYFYSLPHCIESSFLEWCREERNKKKIHTRTTLWQKKISSRKRSYSFQVQYESAEPQYPYRKGNLFHEGIPARNKNVKILERSLRFIRIKNFNKIQQDDTQFLGFFVW